MPDLEDLILPDTSEELMGQQQEQPQQQPVQATGSTGKSVQNLYDGRGEKKIDMTEVTIAPTETYLKLTAKVCPIQPRILTFNQRLERQSLARRKQEVDNSEDTPILTGTTVQNPTRSKYIQNSII